MASTVEEITINYEEDGQLLVKETDKVVLTKGAWSTILFRYHDFDKKQADYGPEKYTIRRYRKVNNEYRQQSKFNISSKEQAQKIIDALAGWISQPVEQ